MGRIRGLTCVDSRAEQQLVLGSVANPEDGHVTEQLQRHAGDVPRMRGVGDGASADHHVRIANCFNLRGKTGLLA